MDIRESLMAENARLEHFFKVVTSVSRALHESTDLSESLQIMVETVTEVFHAKGCTLRVLDPAGKEFELMAATGLSSAYLEKGSSLPMRISRRSLRINWSLSITWAVIRAFNIPMPP